MYVKTTQYADIMKGKLPIIYWRENICTHNRNVNQPTEKT